MGLGPSLWKPGVMTPAMLECLKVFCFAVGTILAMGWLLWIAAQTLGFIA